MSQQQKQQQKQKDSNAPNTSGKQYRPKTATQPAAEVVKEANKPSSRPETAEPSNRGQRGANRGRGRGGRDGDKEGERRRNDPRSDKNSWMYKYWHEPRPKHERILVEKDTELPELIKKEDILARPSKEKMEEEANVIEASIKELQVKKKALHTKLQEIKQGGKMKDSQHTYKEVF